MIAHPVLLFCTRCLQPGDFVDVDVVDVDIDGHDVDVDVDVAVRNELAS